MQLNNIFKDCTKATYLYIMFLVDCFFERWKTLLFYYFSSDLPDEFPNEFMMFVYLRYASLEKIRHKTITWYKFVIYYTEDRMICLYNDIQLKVKQKIICNAQIKPSVFSAIYFVSLILPPSLLGHWLYRSHH